MKLRNILLLSALLSIAFNGYAQELALAGSNTHAATGHNAVGTSNEDDSRTAAYQYTIYGEIPVAHLTFEEEHYLGKSVSSKWNTFLANYTHEYNVEIGLSNSGTEIIKPSIYNAVEHANKYIKKALKKGTLTHEKAVALMNHILDCANVICFENDSERFEDAAKKARNGEEAVKLFEQVKLIRM